MKFVIKAQQYETLGLDWNPLQYIVNIVITENKGKSAPHFKDRINLVFGIFNSWVELWLGNQNQTAWSALNFCNVTVIFPKELSKQRSTVLIHDLRGVISCLELPWCCSIILSWCELQSRSCNHKTPVLILLKQYLIFMNLFIHAVSTIHLAINKM